MFFVIRHPIITQLAAPWDRRCAEPQPCKPRYFHQVLSSWAPACPSLPFKHSLSQRVFCLLFPQYSLPSLPGPLRASPPTYIGQLKDLCIKQKLPPARDSPDRRAQFANYLSVCHGWTEKGRTVRGRVWGAAEALCWVVQYSSWNSESGVQNPLLNDGRYRGWKRQEARVLSHSIGTEEGAMKPTPPPPPQAHGAKHTPPSLSERTERTQWPSHQLPSAGANKLRTVNQGWNPSARKAKERLFFWEGPRMPPASESAFQADVWKAGSSVPATEGKNMYLLYIVRLLQKLFISQNHSAK